MTRVPGDWTGAGRLLQRERHSHGKGSAVSELGNRLIEGTRTTLAGFKEFLMRGNVIELAVAVVVGAAFTDIVNAVVDGMINPLVGALGTQDLDEYQSCLRGPCEVNDEGSIVSGIPIRWGSVISALLSFLITAGVVYFLMIVPLTRILAARKPKGDVPVEQTELDLLIEIRDELIAQRTGTLPAQRTGTDPAD